MPELDVHLTIRGTRRGETRFLESPITGRSEMFAPVVASESELAACFAVIRRRGGTLSTRGSGVLELARVEITFRAFDVHGDLTKVVGDAAVACDFLFDLATAGHLTIGLMGGQQVSSSLVTTDVAHDRAQSLHRELGPCSRVTCATELAAVLGSHTDHGRVSIGGMRAVRRHG